VADQFGDWAPYSAQATATGYDVVWKAAGVDQFTVWTTDSSGNFVSEPIGLVAGNNPALENLETLFHQDLNADGVIGINQTVIEASGSTSLVQAADNFFINPVGQSSGVELQYSGAPVVAGQFGTWAPIGAEATASGYDVVWKEAGADQYTVWNTDSSGNFVSEPVGLVSATNPTLVSLEALFQQIFTSSTVAVSGGVTVTANGAPETFALPANFGADTIKNFNPAIDVLQFAKALFPDMNPLSHAVQVFNDVVITHSPSDTVDSVTLVGVQLASLHAANFVLV
jgi:serralysin